MQGVLGVKPYVPRSNKRARRFSSSWKWKFQQDNPDNVDADMNIYGLRAYDAATAFALAIEKAGTTDFGLQKEMFLAIHQRILQLLGSLYIVQTFL
jgi:ionotropic glutamate receptor